MRHSTFSSRPVWTGIARWRRYCLVPLVCLVLGCASKASWHCDQDRCPPAANVSLTSLTPPVLCDPCHASGVFTGTIQRPQTLASDQPPPLRDMTLEEAVHLGLMHSRVFRELGGAVLRSPDAITSIHSPALSDTDPRFGVEGALSAFDAVWTTRTRFENNDRPLNNQFFGGGTRQLQQDYAVLDNSISKRSAYGTQMIARHLMEYDFNNATGNANPNLPWQTYVDLEVRQPLLNGAGTEINRIAGPNAIPGVYNGVLIARVKTDISLAEFETSVASLVSNVETAYWELYFAYRNLDARRDARDRALETWRIAKNRLETGRGSSSGTAEARAREQYYRLEGELQNALAGRERDNGGSSKFRADGGIYSKERQLRLLLGLPINDVEILNPVSKPTLADIQFDWDMIVAQAMHRRPELRRQQWKIRQRELELCAAEHRTKPQLDAFARYRLRGLGHDMLGYGGSRFDNAVQNLTGGDYQEWQVGFEYSLPIGMRQAHAAVTHALLTLRHEQAVLQEQHRETTLEMSNAIAEKDRAYQLMQTNLNRRLAAEDHLNATEAELEGATENQKPRLLDVLLDAQRRLTEAEADFQISSIEYMLSIKQIHAAQGSLLDYNNVYLSEGQWPHKAYHDAGDRLQRREYTPDREDDVQRGTVVSQHVITPVAAGAD